MHVALDLCEGSVKHRSIHHQDAFLLFRALCNLSVKSHTDDGTGLVNPYGLQVRLVLEVESMRGSENGQFGDLACARFGFSFCRCAAWSIHP